MSHMTNWQSASTFFDSSVQ